MNFNPFGSKPLKFEQITDLSASTALTPPNAAAFAVMVAEAQDVRWRDDGQAPTAAIGMLLVKGVEFTYQGDLSKIRFIQAAASAKLNVSYYAATGGILKP